MPGALSAICGIVGEHPEVEWMGGPQYVFETDVRRQVLQRSTSTPTAVIREGLCDGKHWEMLQQEGTFFSKALWFRAKHGLKGFELAGDWNFWRVMAHHGVYYQYESPLGAFRRRVGQLSVERIGDYRAEIERVVPLEVRRGRFEELYREQEWDAKVIRFDDGSGRMVVGVESVREVYQKVRSVEQSNMVWETQAGSNLDPLKGNGRVMPEQIVLFTPYYKAKQPGRQDELIYCLRRNIECREIEKIVLLIDDNHQPELGSPKIEIVNLPSRATYLDWIELTEKKYADKISVLANTDIYFDASVSGLRELFSTNPKAFVTISRYEEEGSEQTLHKNPHWSQDVWAILGNYKLKDALKQSLKIPLGVPRCDNKIAYLFAIHGTKLYNPCYSVKTVHVQQTNSREYDKHGDTTVLGGTAWVYPNTDVKQPSQIEIDIWSINVSDIINVRINSTWKYYKPNLLAQESLESQSPTQNIKKTNNVIAFDQDWQYPAITEKYAFEMAKKYLGTYEHNDSIVYFGFPWATLIDHLTHNKKDETKAKSLLEQLRSFREYLQKYKKIITCCQHIRMLKFQDIFFEMGITDIFWSHTVKNQNKLPLYPNISLYPFPLYPVQVVDSDPINTQKKYLFSYVGSRYLDFYLTDSRQKIVDYLSDDPRGLIIIRDKWHYNKIVYDYQIHKKISQSDHLVDQVKSVEFQQVMKQSVFSLCPSGSGPNSIRLWESISLGTIPVILADTYLPPGNLALWQEATISFPETSEDIKKLPEYLGEIHQNHELLEQKRHALKQLKMMYGLDFFIYDIAKLFVAHIQNKVLLDDLSTNHIIKSNHLVKGVTL
jgi:hypothetical protein